LGSPMLSLAIFSLEDSRFELLTSTLQTLRSTN
jgi:hypothetical protein